MRLFKNYRRTNHGEMRPVTEKDNFRDLSYAGVSISDEDARNGSPKIGDMIARNPTNHKDQWLVAEQYFLNNFEEM